MAKSKTLVTYVFFMWPVCGNKTFWCLILIIISESCKTRLLSWHDIHDVRDTLMMSTEMQEECKMQEKHVEKKYQWHRQLRRKVNSTFNHKTDCVSCLFHLFQAPSYFQFKSEKASSFVMAGLAAPCSLIWNCSLGGLSMALLCPVS